jgi:hypothetical protein
MRSDRSSSPFGSVGKDSSGARHAGIARVGREPNERVERHGDSGKSPVHCAKVPAPRRCLHFGKCALHRELVPSRTSVGLAEHKANQGHSRPAGVTRDLLATLSDLLHGSVVLVARNGTVYIGIIIAAYVVIAASTFATMFACSQT